MSNEPSCCKPPGVLLQVLSVGASVVCGDSDGVIKAKVKRINISAGDRVEYEVVWWSGDTYNTRWLDDFEVSAGSFADRISIGFSA